MKPKRSDRRDVGDRGLRINDRNPSSKDVRSEDEPIPMKDRKPVNKHPNAADNFWNTHQAEYEDRGQPPNRCGYVESHNDACPKLKDELDKKRDASNPIACANIQEHPRSGIHFATQTLISERDWSDPNCIICSVRPKHAKTLRRRNIQQERRSRDSRVSKSRRRPPKRIIKINKATSANRENQNVEQPNSDPKDPKSEADLESRTRYHNSSRASLYSQSSYNSYMSMEHEPMD